MSKWMAIWVLVVTGHCFAEQTQLSKMTMSGHWQGELYYLDYQSGKRFSIPLAADIEMTPDNATLLRKLTYTDPGRKVYAMTLTTVDQKTGEWVETYFREHSAQLFRYQIVTSEVLSDRDWTLIYQHSGEDDNKPALIQHTLVRKGNVMTSQKAVSFLDSPNNFIQRNGTHLELIKARD